MSDTLAADTETEIAWSWADRTIRLGLSRRGSGPTVLLLPALSSISTRAEMRPLQEQLASGFEAVAVDWPGFGDRPRPRIAWRPEAYTAYLRHLLEEVVPRPVATVTAGHAAGFALRQAATAPGSTGRLCLVAPTWRGPLPTMAGKRHPAFRRIVHTVDLPFIGPALYALNVNRPVVRMMGRGHVYEDPDWLSGPRLEEKLGVVRAPGARHASIRFVTGGLDLLESREEFLALGRRVSEPILVVYGGGTPPKSKAEMEALCRLANVRAVVLPTGKLSVHEEFPGPVADPIVSFLAGDTSPR